MLILMDNFSQPLQTNNKQFKKAVTFLSGYNGNFNVTNENNKFYFIVPIDYDDFTQFIIPPGAYKIEGLYKETE